jgi:hypothetical protein
MNHKNEKMKNPRGAGIAGTPSNGLLWDAKAGLGGIWGDDTKSARIVRLAKLRRCSRAQQFELKHDFQTEKRAPGVTSDRRQKTRVPRSFANGCPKHCTDSTRAR